MFAFLRKATDSQQRSLGPFVSTTDFSTLRNDLTIANTDIKLFKNGGSVSNKASGGGTSRGNGEYGVTFNATDTSTTGELRVSVAMAGALVVTRNYHVLEQNVYDALFGASANLGSLVTENNQLLNARGVIVASAPWRDGVIDVTEGDNYTGDVYITKDFYDPDHDLTTGWTATMTWKDRNGTQKFTANSTFEEVATDWYRIKFQPTAAATEGGPLGNRALLYDVQFNGPSSLKITKEHGYVNVKKQITTT